MTLNPIEHIRNHHRNYLILLLWLIATACNLFKSFHIDDTFHIEAAQHIIDTPLKPMSGEVNWSGDTKQISEFNQPPLLFYLISPIIYCFGANEIALHLLISLFSLLALYYFERLLYYFNNKNASFFLTIFALCPAFVINQNVMTDIPLLSLLLGSSYYFISRAQHRKNILLSFTLVSIALLIKYTALPFLGALVFGLVFQKEYKNVLYALIPIGILSLWSGWNYWEFGNIHLLGRPKSVINLIRVPEFLCCIGAIMFINPFRQRIFATTYYLIVLGLLFLGWIISLYVNSILTIYLQSFFLINGLLIIVFTLNMALNNYSSKNQFLLISLCLISCFIIFLAPFIATRHILLIIPFIILLIHTQNIEIGKISKTLGIATSAVLCFGLVNADNNYASFYEQKSKEIVNKLDGTIYTIGHWGWQWYARQNGMLIYDKQLDSLKINDIMIVPKDIAKQGISENIELGLIETIVEPNTSVNPFSVSNHGSFYNSFIDRPVWTFSSQPLDTLCVYKVIGTLPSNINH